MAVDAAGALSPGHLAERPLLPRGAPAVRGEPPEQLDAKYARYARRFPYGVICRGLLVPAEAPRLTLVAVVLLLLCSTTSWALVEWRRVVLAPGPVLRALAGSAVHLLLLSVVVYTGCV